MSETSLEQRYHEPWHRSREVNMISLLGRRARSSFHDLDASPGDRPKENVLVEVEEVMHPPKVEALGALYWRSEILQVMFWLKGEGFGDEADATRLERFLGVDAHIGVQHLDRLREEGYLERVGDRYKLSEAGAREGGLEFAASFEELMKPTQCSPDSWCQNSRDDDRLLE